MNNQELAKEILALVGGEKNITDVMHCYTRLRFHLKKIDLADKEKIEELPGVINVQIQSGQFQVVIGNKVSKVYKELIKLGEFKQGDSSEITVEKKKGNLIGRFFEVISTIFSPIVPAIAGAGMLKGLLGLVTVLGWVEPTSSVVTMLQIISDCVFYFLPFFLAVSAARIFKTNEFIAVAVAGGMMYPIIMEGAKAIANGGPTGLDLFGLPVPFINYSSTVIPIILAVWILSYLYRWVDRWMPDSLGIVFTPTIVLMLIIPIQLIVIGPLGSYLGIWLAEGVTWLFAHGGILAGGLLGATRPLLVIVGMHYGLMPIAIQNIAVLGHDYLLPVFLMANMGQAAAALAVFLKTKNKDLKAIAGSSTIAGFLGITEPAMYGVNLRLKKPFIAALIGSGIGGAFVTGFGVTGNAFVLPGIMSLPVFMGPKFVYLIIGMILTITITIVLTFLMKFEDAPSKNTKGTAKKQNKASSIEHTTILSPVIGTTVALKDVPDATFAEEIMGKGMAVNPTVGEIYAPFNGEVATFFKTGHAIGLRSEEGVELLIHVGIDTVNLNGAHFHPQVKQGDQVKTGDLLLTFDLAEIKQAGYETITPVIVTNTENYLDVIGADENAVMEREDWLIQVINKMK
ncbi:beta-glucoside-specific PTS transporter subunit IIABC [Listeria cossartiae]|uniref:beta-glucoside-specific PTS transporter subunit IIABC n=1 Tax=Listeria cossartiae TaxID=2838249 RepID=UPI001E41E568|nr:beta-glucoside-specific PTS transporter subunit IIABC [Listeria cossartiae]MCD2224508.1 beta-glucoside-specific PTS transporter subunit IIABC [Listeria cossartiae]MCD2239430.1 beta-glucoside-specific PTS transporter subunit IIABC [Listeria cossartiae]